ncbi:hypothetical protein ES703_93913 [subsurface metagenome]
MNLNTGLVISGSAENLALGGRDGGIAGDEGSSHSTQGLNTQGEGSNIKQKHILDLSLEHTCLNSSTDSYYLIRVDPLMRLSTEKLLHLLVN